MPKIPESVKSQKELLAMVWLIVTIIEYRNFPEPYSTGLLVLGAVPFGILIFGVRTLAKYQGGLLNIMVTEINSDYLYQEGGNAGMQIVLGDIISSEEIGGRWFVKQRCLEPYIVHPKNPDTTSIIYTEDTPITTLLYWVDIPPQMMFTGKKRQTIKWLEEYVESNHTDRATLDEVDIQTINGVDLPIFDVIEGTESYRMRRGNFDRKEIEDMEVIIRELRQQRELKINEPITA